jgi:hypothetical protein
MGVCAFTGRVMFPLTARNQPVCDALRIAVRFSHHLIPYFPHAPLAIGLPAIPCRRKIPGYL